MRAEELARTGQLEVNQIDKVALEVPYPAMEMKHSSEILFI